MVFFLLALAHTKLLQQVQFWLREPWSALLMTASCQLEYLIGQNRCGCYHVRKGVGAAW